MSMLSVSYTLFQCSSVYTIQILSFRADLRSTYQLEHDRVLEGAHRQDVTVLSVDEDLLMASSKEKMISFWNWRTGTFLTHIKDAHNRLITG